VADHRGAFELTEGTGLQVNIFMSRPRGMDGRRMSDPGTAQITGYSGGPKGKPYSVKLDFYLDANTSIHGIDWVKMEITKEDDRR